jgi:hypothetical protein
VAAQRSSSAWFDDNIDIYHYYSESHHTSSFPPTLARCTLAALRGCNINYGTTYRRSILQQQQQQQQQQASTVQKKKHDSYTPRDDRPA